MTDKNINSEQSTKNTVEQNASSNNNKRGIVRRAYDWVLHWADTRWGILALFLLAFAESSFFPIPPDVLLIACCLGLPLRSSKVFYVAAICTLGSAFGGVAGYMIGSYGWESLSGWFIPSVFSQEAFDSVGQLYDNYNFWVVFTAGFTPIPYKVITITAGVFEINFALFCVASIISRGARFFLIAWLIKRFGPSIKAFIDKYFNLVAIAFTVLLVGCFVLISYL
ncbi:MAG: YqaA family protein [Rikenellaceae bacterium]